MYVLQCHVCEQVCNHPDLFEGRPIVSAFDMRPLRQHWPSCVLNPPVPAPWTSVSPALLDVAFPSASVTQAWEADEVQVVIGQHHLCLHCHGNHESNTLPTHLHAYQHQQELSI